MKPWKNAYFVFLSIGLISISGLNAYHGQGAR